MAQPKDWKQETIDLICAYLRIDTTNPPGNETAAASFFADIFSKEGIAHTVWESKPGRGSIMARIPRDGGAKAPDPGALVLMHHSDVVPAEASQWSFDPFGGKVIDGYVCGRGALDTKGLGIMELMAFLAAKREGLALVRDLVFLAAADEEMGADWGVDWLFKHHYDEIKASLVINEGGVGISDLIGGKFLHMVATGEKGLCWLELIRTGPPGHGSTPHGAERAREAQPGADPAAGRPDSLSGEAGGRRVFQKPGPGVGLSQALRGRWSARDTDTAPDRDRAHQ